MERRQGKGGRCLRSCQKPAFRINARGQKAAALRTGRDKGPAMKASKEKHVDGSTRISAKKPAARDRSSQLPKKTSSKENKGRSLKITWEELPALQERKRECKQNS